ncbi:MAG: aldo/keto reductase family protein [Phycisphaerales bacterium]
MKYRRLGAWGTQLSEIGFGSWLTIRNHGQDIADQLHRTAYENGINFFDTANVYGGGETEGIVGRALKPFQRETYVLATKLFFPFQRDWPFPGANDRGLSRKQVFERCHVSLKQLGTDYIDLYQCHRYDEDTPLAETCHAFNDLINQGKVLYWGVSQWTAAQIVDAVELCQEHGWHLPACNQPQYNMLQRHWEDEVFPTCMRHGLGIVCFSPLAEGILTGKYTDGVPADSRAGDPNQNQFIKDKLNPTTLQTVARLAELADGLGLTMSVLALAWCLRRLELTSAIIGASKSDQIIENVAASDVTLDDDVLDRINAILGK